MKFNKNLLLSLGLMIGIASIYRILPNRAFGFAPQIAMALFGGAFFIKQKQWAFALPLISMFISDALYQILYQNGLSEIQGFYEGQWINYLLIASMTIFGFMLSDLKILKVVFASFAAPTSYFILSNSAVWIGNGGYQRGRTMSGWIQTMVDGLPFYYNSILGTLVFGALLFGTYALLRETQAKKLA